MFGRNPRLPIDAAFHLDSSEPGKMRVSHKNYAHQWEKKMKQAFDILKKHAGKSADYNKKHYDQKVRDGELEVGDRVLVKNHEKGGTGK